jgi:hypothetical protein
LKSFGDNPASRGFDTNEYNWAVNSCVDFTYKALSIISDTLGGYEGHVIPSWNVQDQKLRAVIQDLEIRNAVDPVPGPSQGDPAAVQAVTVSVDKNAAENMLGHPFDPTDAADVEGVANGISAGTLTAAINYVPGQGNDRLAMQSDNSSQNRIVMSAGQSDNTILMVQNGQTKLLLLNNNDGSSRQSEFDPDNMHPYTELDITKGADGKVTAAQMKLDGQSNTTADFSSVGQVLGSALGRALAPNNQFVQLAAGTVVGAIGQKLAQAFSASLATNGADVSLSSVFSDFNVSIASAGASSVASFLVAELGTALNFPGFGGQLFNAAAGGFAGSVASQVATQMAKGASFDLAIGGIQWASAATNAAYGVSSLFGTLLGQELVPAQTHEGAVGGQLLGAVGSAIGITAALSNLLGSVLDFFLPGVGSLIGTILGTLIGDAFGSVPHPAAVDLLDQAGTLYAATHYQTSASDGGDYSTPDQLVVPALAIINAYLGAVKGAALDHHKQVTLGYQANPVFYIDGVPGHPAIGEYLYPNAAVQAAALDVLQNTEVIGGDLLMKRAHQNSSSSHPPPPPPPPDPSTNNGDPGATGTVVVVSAAEQLAVMSGDLSLAQDYENYLNNREAINALMAANPDSAFTAGWIATFARVNELGLNHVNASDFLGGLVGYLDSVSKAGLGPVAANASVSHGGADDSVITVSIKVPNGAEVPGSLVAFADVTSVSSDATGQTVQLTFGANLAQVGIHRLGATAAGGDGASDLWFGGAGGNNFAGTGGHDILTGGAGNDTIRGGTGFDFIDGGAGADTLFGDDGNDILRGGTGNDVLYGGGGNDTYLFARGDGADAVVDNAGADSLVFGTGIGIADISISISNNGNNFNIGVKHAGSPNEQTGQITDVTTVLNWSDPLARIEKLVFADGTVLDLATTPLNVPFGATLSGSAVAEHSAVGTLVGTVHGFDFAANAVLTYAMVDSAGGRFTADAATGNIIVANGTLLNYDIAQSYAVTVRTYDQIGHSFDNAFTINLIDVPNRAPVLTMAASSIKADQGQVLQVSSWFSTFDADNDQLTYCFADGTPSASSGQFVLNGTPLGQGAIFSVSVAQLAGLTFVAGAADSPDGISMQLTDGHAASENLVLSVNVNHAPVVAVASPNVPAVAGQVLQASSLFSATDADDDAVGYYVVDYTPDANSGHFVVNGTAVAAQTVTLVSAAQLAGPTFVATPHRSRNYGANARRHFSGSGWCPAKGATTSMACIHTKFA